MKRFIWCVGMFWVGAVTATALPYPQEKKADDPKPIEKLVHFKQLQVDNLTIKSKDGNNTMSIVGGDDYVGLWLTQKGKKTYSYMFSQTGLFKPYFAIGWTGDYGGDPVAIFLDEETGTPLIQLKTGVGRAMSTNHYRLADVVAAIAKVELKNKPVNKVKPPE